MAHRTIHDPHLHLQAQLDRYPLGAPGERLIREILTTIYTREEADLAARLPLGFSTLEKLSKKLKLPEVALRTRLDSMADKGLVLDLTVGGEVRYALPPTLVGLFEFSMMRVREDIDQRRLAGLYHRYLVEEPEYFSRLRDNTTTPFRTLIHESAIPADYSEVLDYERATKLIESASYVAVGFCHCRHVAKRLGRACGVFDLESCLSFGAVADYLVRHRLARRIEPVQGLALIAESHRQGMVHIGDNVQREPNFLCNCCKCCCEVLASFKRFEFLSNVFSSNFEAHVEASRCTGCRRCETACPLDAIRVEEGAREEHGRRSTGVAGVEPSLCLGCGVCVAACKEDALRMMPRPARRVVPKNTVTRTLMMAVENGRLQNLLFDPDANLSSAAIHRLLAAVMRLPATRRLLARNAIKSRFVEFLASAAR